MMNWNHWDQLELVEYVAEQHGAIASESELSELFDAEIAPMVIAQYGADDVTAIRTAFNDWADALCSDGTIHPAQCESYCYVGEFDND